MPLKSRRFGSSGVLASAIGERRPLPTPRAADDADYIPSLANALSAIELFTAENPEWTLSQIARALELTPGSTRRVLRTLELLGYAVADEGRFRLTARVLNLGFAYL